MAQDLKQEIGECGLYYYSVCLKFFVWLKPTHKHAVTLATTIVLGI